MNPQALRRLGRRGRPLKPLAIAMDARRELEGLTRRKDVPERIALRARLVLLAGEGLSNVAVAERLGVSPQRVGRWRQRFAHGGPAALCDQLRDGAPVIVASADARGQLQTARAFTAEASFSPATAARMQRAEALQPTRSLRMTAIYLHRFDCVAAFVPTTESPQPQERTTSRVGQSAVRAQRGLTRQLAERIRGAAQFRMRSRGGMKLRRFLRSLVRSLATDAEPDPEIHLAVSSAEPATRAVRRWLSKQPRVRVHVLGSARRWWSVVDPWLEHAPAGRGLERLALELAIVRYLHSGPSSKPFSWAMQRGVVAAESIQ